MKHWRKWKYSTTWNEIRFPGWGATVKDAMTHGSFGRRLKELATIAVMWAAMAVVMRGVGIRFWLKKGNLVRIGGDWGFARSAVQQMEREALIEAL